MTNNTIPNVPRDWFDRVHALLYKIAHESTPEGLEAECLGSFIPDILSATSPAGVDGLEVFITDCATCIDVVPAKTVTDARVVLAKDAKAIIDGLRGEVAKINSDRLACWAEFKVMTRACLDAEKERDQQAETISNYKSQFSELHTARNLLSRLSAAGFELGDDAAVSVIAERDQQAQRIGELEGLLRSCLPALSDGGCAALANRIDAALSAGKDSD